MPPDPLSISCGRHGSRISAVVCRHHVTDQGPVGWIENSDDPADMQAWCAACEEVFKEQGALTEEFRRFNQAVLVCDLCYIGLKSRHSLRDP